MRLFLLPISSRQSLIYCQRLNQRLPHQKPTYLDRISTKATTTWLDWEKKETGWQKTITSYGNKLFQRLPHEEYGLKSIPPLNERRKKSESADGGEVTVHFPLGWIEEPKVLQTLRELGSNTKQAFHTKWLVGSLIGMPLVAPFALVPVIPNLPFFYLCFRAWSHWRARSGSKHLEFLLERHLVKLRPIKTLNFAYLESTMDRSVKEIEDEIESIGTDIHTASGKDATEEHMILSQPSAALIAAQLEIPEIQMEIERAVWQVERNINAKQNLQDTAESISPEKKSQEKEE